MLRALLIALSGIVYFFISLPMMMPLRISPVTNYNLFYMPFLAIMVVFLVVKACTVSRESKAYIYAFFAAIVTWQLVGEVASINVPAGYITQFSNFNFKVVGAYFPVLTGWVLLLILWRTRSLKNSVAVFVMTFLGLWSFELYMENYSLKVPLALMPAVANVLLVVFTLLTVLLVYVARKATTDERKTAMGCLLYLTITIVIMSSSQWKKPQSFYLKYEPAHIAHEIEELKEELIYLNKLKTELGMVE
jgi:hypothetical protein